MKGKIIEVTPTIDTAIYSAGDHLGTLHTLIGAAGGNSHMCELEAITIIDKDLQKSALDIFFFDALPTITSLDNAAANISDAEMIDKCIGHLVVLALDYRDLSANSTAHIRNLNIALKSDPDSSAPVSMYAFVVSRGIPVFATASSLVFKYHFSWL